MTQPIPSSTSHRQPIPLHWVESLFKRMSLSYGARFADMWTGVDAQELKQYWAERLGNLSNEELATGYHMLDAFGRPPTLPEFIKLCRPNLDPEQAFYEALEQGRRREQGDPDYPEAWSHAAIYWAWVKVGRFAIENQGYESLRSRWTETLRNCANDPDLPAIPQKLVELPAPGKTRLQPDRARKLLATLKTGSVSLGAAVGQAGWAKRIIERYERGEHVDIGPLEMAMQALGMRR